MDCPLYYFLGSYSGDEFNAENAENAEPKIEKPKIEKPKREIFNKKIMKTQKQKQKQTKKIENRSYRGDRYNVRDASIKLKITESEFTSNKDEWKHIIESKEFNVPDIIRAKQLRRRALCKGYSKDTRRRSSKPDLSYKKQKKDYLQKLIEENTQLKAENAKLKQLLNNYM